MWTEWTEYDQSEQNIANVDWMDRIRPKWNEYDRVGQELDWI